MLEPVPNEDLVRCPNCAELICKDAILCRFCETGFSELHFYPCPSCTESIRKEATVCRFCRTKLHKSKYPQEEPIIRHYQGTAVLSENITAKFSANKELIREREKFVIEQLTKEFDVTELTNLNADAQSQFRARIREIVNSDPAPLTMMEKGILLQNVLDEVFGFGPLGPLLRDPSVGDICVNGINNIYVERHGRLEKANIFFEDAKHLRQTMDKVVRSVGKRLDDNSPMVRARLPNGSHINATIPPITLDGPTLTIRSFGPNNLSLGQLVEKGTMSIQMAEVLKSCVKARVNLIISGGVNCGKTTLLNALCGHINPQERIITIENQAELRLQHDDWVRMETQPATANKAQITQDMLTDSALWMRPDRIIYGSCTGIEVLAILQAINTGLSGFMTTVHANDPQDCIKRLENMILIHKETPLIAIRELIASTIQVIVQIQRLEDGSIRITEISEIVGIENDIIAMTNLFRLEKKDVMPVAFLNAVM